MPTALEIVVGFVVLGLVAAMVVALRRMGWLGRTERRASTGMASWMQDFNNMLQPNQPRAEEIRRVSEEAAEREREDGEGDGRDPRRRR